jgi:secondary thiamine-phosphate synthase enzyme
MSGRHLPRNPRKLPQEQRMTTSKGSRVTVRASPVQGSDAQTFVCLHAESLLVQTDQRIELIDVTDAVFERVRLSGVRHGIASLWSMHTTCALFVNEAQKALHADILRALEEIVARDADWLHNDPQHSDCDRMNADSHLRAMFLGHSVTVQISDGEPVLGQWQRILVGEMDGPRERTVRLQILGIA